MRIAVWFGVLALAWAASPAAAWTRAGHMVSAAIAYDDLAARDPQVIDKVVALMASHPDHAPFEVAVGRASGPERARRLFMQMARWPDDARGGVFDHPTWHYALRPIVGRDAPVTPADAVDGAAIEALALNLNEASDARAPAADRALALCWLFHVVGDIHQPLHTAQLFSARFPHGDHGGSQEWVRDPVTGGAVTLHWFFDDSVSRSDESTDAMAKARDLETRYPRASLPELAPAAPLPAAFAHWAFDESYPVAKALAWRSDAVTGETKETAARLPPTYVAGVRAATARRMALAGYRLADVLRAALGGAYSLRRLETRHAGAPEEEGVGVNRFAVLLGAGRADAVASVEIDPQ
jgi:hypothetical protein